MRKQYIVTLLKDLPDVKKGFSFLTDEYTLNHIACSDTPMSCSVLRYKDNPEFVSVKVDLSKAYPLQCPECGAKSLFDYVDEERKYSYYWLADEETYYYEAGLECALCGYKLHTHNVR